MQPGEMTALLVQALCHMVIDHMPARAYGELLPVLVEMRDFYAIAPKVEHPRLPAVRPVKVLGRTTRREVEFGEE